MITNNKLTKIILTCFLILSLSICDPKHQSARYYPNYVPISDPLSIHVQIFNSTHQITS